MAIGAVVGGVYSIGKGLGISLDDINPFGGGSDCTDDSYASQAELAENINKYLTQADMQQLVRGTDSNVPPNPSDMALFYQGGRDCKHKNVGAGDQRFLDELPRLVRQRAREAAAEQNQTYTDSRNNTGPGQPQGPATPSMYALGPSGLLGSPSIIIAIIVGLIYFFGVRGSKA